MVSSRRDVRFKKKYIKLENQDSNISREIQEKIYLMGKSRLNYFKNDFKEKCNQWDNQD